MLLRVFAAHPGCSGAGKGVGLLLLALLSSQAGWGQRPQPPRKSALPADADKKELSPRQVEEALRLLLRADSLQQASWVQPGMEADAEGFVLDQTITKPGHDFYELFYSSLQAITGLGDYTITLSERPIRGTSSLISMNVNDTELLEMPLPTRTEQIEEAVAAAVETASDYLTEQQALSTQMETVHPTSAASPTPAPPPRRLGLSAQLDNHLYFNDQLDLLARGSYNDYYWGARVGAVLYLGRLGRPTGRTH